jgi:hypothetical protein
MLAFQLPWLPERLVAARDFQALRRALRRQPARPGAFNAQDIDRYVAAAAQPGVWVPDIRVASCDLRVLMDQPTEAISSHDLPRRRQDNWHAGPKGGACPKARCGRWPL